MRGCFMKKNVTKLATSMLAACFLTVGAIPALAGTWQKSGNNWTYLNDAGQMVAGQMVNDNNHLYYLGTDGIMKTGFVPINGAYYYFNPSGDMITGWVLDNGAWYYMQGTADHFGQMAVNTTQTVNGKTYYFGADGKMVANTTIGGTQYGADGAAVVNNFRENSNAGAISGGTDSTDNAAIVSMAGGEYLNIGGLNLKIDYGVSKPSNYNHDQFVNEVYQLVNQERTKRGLNPLTLSPELNQIADERAEEISTDFSHNGFQSYKDEISASFGTYIIGENIAYGAQSAADVMYSWMTSSGHKANILDNRYSNIGIGIYQTSEGYLYYSQVFVG